MKKTNLNWRLKELPDAVDVAELVDKKVITPEEARELLFNDSKEVDKDEKVKALKEQIEFLEKIVDALSHNRTQTITYNPVYPTRYWSFNSAGGLGNGVTYTASSPGVMGAVSVNTAKLIS